MFTVGKKYVVVLKDRRAFQDQLSDGTIGTLSKVYRNDGEMLGNFKECDDYNYPLKYCTPYNESKTLRLLKAIHESR